MYIIFLVALDHWPMCIQTLHAYNMGNVKTLPMPIFTLSLNDIDQSTSTLDFTPTNKTPMTINTPTDGNLFSFIGTSRCCQCNGDFSSLECSDSSTTLRSSNIDEKCFANCQFRDFGLFRVVRLDTEQSTE
jgi:hypothetical protein